MKDFKLLELKELSSNELLLIDGGTESDLFAGSVCTGSVSVAPEEPSWFDYLVAYLTSYDQTDFYTY